MKARLRLSAKAAAPRVQARPAPIPHKALMVSRFGQRAAHVPVLIGSAVGEALRRRQSDAAALDGVIFLPRADVPSDLVAHELVHALQQGPPSLADMSAGTLVARLDRAPALPAQSAAESEARAAADLGPGEAPSQSLPAGIAALRRTGETGTPDRAPPPPEPARAPAAEPRAPAAESGAAAPGAAPAGSETVPAIAPTFTLPEAPETALDPEVAAQRAAEAEAAEAALAAADSPSAAVQAYAEMAPSVKARNMASLGTRIDEANSRSTAEVAAATPPVEVAISGSESDMPTPPPIALPGSVSAEEAAAAAPPVIEVPAGPEQPVLRVDPSYGSFIERFFAAGAQPEQIDQRIDAVSTSNPGIETQVAERADIPLEGASDPEAMDRDAAARRDEAGAARGEAAQAVVTGPGPEQVVPRAIEHSVPAAELTAAPLTPLTAAPETEQLQQLALPEEVVAGFDSATSAQMAQTANATRDQMVTAETQRDTEHEAALNQAETDRAAAETRADEDQRREVGAQREAIQTERQRTVDQQAVAVEDVNGQAETARRENRAEADGQIARDRAAINDTYDQAERDSAAEVARGEREAEAERERKRREAENASWWERAVSFIKDAFNALMSLVNAIFDAIRSVVTGIIDLARRAVTGLIALAAQALQALVSAFGELLKGLVDNLLGAVFPELAAALTRAIDGAVALANRAIAAVATVLTDAVNAIAATLTAACNALLNAFQGAINAALALAQAALTGDWSGFLRQILESVLRLLGIDPAAFYALIAQASDAISIIVNDPMHFVSNLVDVFIGGVQLFSDHFLDHLRRGIIGWLTGALGDIQLPNEWNLWSVLDLIRQVLGLTWDFLRERASRVIGPENVARIEMAFSWIATLVTEGWAGLWQRIEGELQSLQETVLNAIKSFVLERVIMASITWLASLFNPVGAIVKLVMTIWNLYQFLRNQMQRLMGIAQAVVAMISNIAHDVLEPAKLRVEEVLANLVPVVIDLLMSLLGVTGVATRVREIIADVRATIANAADRLIERTMVALGLRPGAPAAPGAPGAAAPDAAGQIGHPVPIDVAQGEDHTLRIDRTGAGGATVMLCSAPRPLAAWLDTLAGLAAREPDAAKKALIEGRIGEVRTLLARLDPIADRAAAAPAAPAATAAVPASAAAGTTGTAAAASAEAASIEDQIAPLVRLIFDDLAGAASAFADRYRADINNAHPQARAMIGDDLRAHSAEWQSLPDWAAVSARLKDTSELFRSPLDTGRAFGRGVREDIEHAIPAAHSAIADRLMTTIFQKVREPAHADFVALRLNLHEMILSQTRTLDAATVSTAIDKAVEAVNAAAGDRDPRLLAALAEAGGVINFMTAIAMGGSPGGINEAELERLWAIPANAHLLADRFRAVDPGQHEWIPSNFISRVIARAAESSRAGEEAGEAAALWIDVHNVWRSDTGQIIFKPQGETLRAFVVETIVPGAAPVRRRAAVLQGHSGAIYAAARDSGPTPGDIGQQTKGQGPWHDRLRDMFVAGAEISESRAALATIISNVETFARETVWGGETSGAIEAFDEYYPGDSGGAKLSISALSGRGATALANIQRDFRAARGIIR